MSSSQRSVSQSSSYKRRTLRRDKRQAEAATKRELRVLLERMHVPVASQRVVGGRINKPDIVPSRRLVTSPRPPRLSSRLSSVRRSFSNSSNDLGENVAVSRGKQLKVHLVRLDERVVRAALNKLSAGKFHKDLPLQLRKNREVMVILEKSSSIMNVRTARKIREEMELTTNLNRLALSAEGRTTERRQSQQSQEQLSLAERRRRRGISNVEHVDGDRQTRVTIGGVTDIGRQELYVRLTQCDIHHYVETPRTPPLIWPPTPSPRILTTGNPHVQISQLPTTTVSTPVEVVVVDDVPSPSPQSQPLPEPERPPPRRRRHADIPKRVTYKKAILATDNDLENLCENPHYCGRMTDICGHCGALFFNEEPCNRQRIRLMCCKDGSYSPPPLRMCPTSLKNLYVDNTRLARQFKENIRRINSLFAMASYKTTRPTLEDEQLQRRGQGAWSYTICGQIYHFLEGVPTSQDLQRPKHSHYYFLDVDEAMQKRNEFVGENIDPEIIRIIETNLRRINPWIQAYKTMSEVLEEERIRRGDGRRPVEDVVIGFTKEPNMNVLRRNFNLPESRSDIAAVFYGMDPPFNVELKVYPTRMDASQEDRRHQRIKNLSPLLDPMAYPLLFPYGEKGYSTELKHIRGRDKTVTMSEYFRYRLMVRDGAFLPHNAGKLFQQYLVDAWVRVETDRLWYIRQHQDRFRLAVQETLRRYNERRRDGGADQVVGKAYILPAKFIGSEKYRQRQYLDAMAVVARHGKPDLFITFTCNPRWKEIREAIGENEKWENRPDIVCRVFHTKLLEFMDDLTQKQLWGVVLNYYYVIEFQKRGLPHCHIVVTFIAEDKLQEAEAVDRIVHAVIPDRDVQPRLYNKVANLQIHGPCGSFMPEAACTRGRDKCSKGYPRRYAEETRLHEGDNQRPAYKRPADGRTIYYADQGRTVDNRFVVPYNPYALAKYECHINFEVCGSVNTLKYLHKYLNKGNDFVNIYEVDQQQQQQEDEDQENNGELQVEGGRRVVDEIRHYVECRYVSSMEAAWRLLEYKMSDRSHSVLVLPVHLPGQRQIIYDEDDDVEAVDDRLNKPSKLEAYFNLNSNDPEARQYKYVEIPEHYVWNDREAEWRRRRQVSKQIGCLIHVSPTEGQIEKYYLRVLLTHVRGATSFEDLLSVNGRVCQTFKESCEERNLLRNIDAFDRTMEEASLQRHPRMLRNLFALICCVVTGENLRQIPYLWNKYRDEIIADFIHGRRMRRRAALERALQYIQNIITRNKENLTLDGLGVHLSESESSSSINSSDDEDERNLSDADNDDGDDGYGRGERIVYNPSGLNRDQKKIFLRVLRACARINNFTIPNEIYDSLSSNNDDDDDEEGIATVMTEERRRNNENVFYLDGPGGTGKTFLYNTILQTLNETFRLNNIAVAWTGIAAILLRGGSTVHRAFKLPLEIKPNTMPGWPMEAPQTERVRRAAIIIWDEAPMTPSKAVEAVDRYLRDIMRRDVPMGGKCVLFGGDFRQVLPVVTGGNRAQTISSCLKTCKIWPAITKLSLKENMRARQQEIEKDLGNQRFSEWLLKLGSGRLPFVTLNEKVIPSRFAPRDLIEIPKKFQVESLEELLDFVFEGRYTVRSNGEKAILCPTNAAVSEVNNLILDRIRAESKTYVSVDSYEADEDDEYQIPMDLVNAVDTPSLPPHELVLKVGAIVILLRNFDVGAGQCNGTRLIVTQLGENMIECELLTGENRGERIWLPKIDMRARDITLPKEINRVQFPIKLAYAMTINKSQGQTLSKVGIYLKRPCFTHGQLYVAFSRVGSSNNVKIYVKDDNSQGTFKFRGRRRFTRNIVFESVLEDNLDPVPERTVYEEIPVEDNNGGEDVDRQIVDQVNQSVQNVTGSSRQGRPRTPDDDELLAILLDHGLIENEDEVLPRDMVPFRTDSQLRARVAVGDKPGTSGIQILEKGRYWRPRQNYSDDDDDDSD